MFYQYKTKGTCCTMISIELQDGIIQDVVFQNGCSGNLDGLRKLVRGRPAQEVIDLLLGSRCGSKTTSCPDQLARGLREALQAQ